MKVFFTTIAVLIVLSAKGQCASEPFFPFKVGCSFEQVHYDADGNQQGKSVSKVEAIEGNKALVANSLFDSRDKLVTETNYTVICDVNATRIDFQQFIPEDMLKQYGDSEIVVEGDFVSLPNELSVGQTLPDSEGKMIVNMSGANIEMTIDMTITERIVEEKATIETPAGSFDSFKISQKMLIEMNMMGATNTIESSSASWFSKSIGLTKAETYDGRGIVTDYLLLANFSN